LSFILQQVETERKRSTILKEFWEDTIKKFKGSNKENENSEIYNRISTKRKAVSHNLKKQMRIKTNNTEVTPIQSNEQDEAEVTPIQSNEQDKAEVTPIQSNEQDEVEVTPIKSNEQENDIKTLWCLVNKILCHPFFQLILTIKYPSDI
jgi:hypothetical protein